MNDVKIKSRIKLTDTTIDVMVKMCEGSPGAITVCKSILEQHDIIDPQGTLGGLGAILMLDTLKIYGPDIWMLYKDVCGCKIDELLGLLRAWQLGFLSKEKLKYAIENRGRDLDKKYLFEKVTKEIPSFKLTT